MSFYKTQGCILPSPKILRSSRSQSPRSTMMKCCSKVCVLSTVKAVRRNASLSSHDSAFRQAACRIFLFPQMLIIYSSSSLLWFVSFPSRLWVTKLRFGRLHMERVRERDPAEVSPAIRNSLPAAPAHAAFRTVSSCLALMLCRFSASYELRLPIVRRPKRQAYLPQPRTRV
jgi:hypothetical protein